jgi:hypothetical protein
MQQTMRKSVPVYGWRIPNISGLAGAIAGLLSGLTVVILSPIVGWLNGIDSNLLGALNVTSLATHIAASMLLGAIFGIVYRRALQLTTDFGLPIYAGLAYGIFMFSLAAAGMLPTIDPGLRESSAGIGFLMLQYLVFGMSLGVCYLRLRPAPYRHGYEQR